MKAKSSEKRQQYFHRDRRPQIALFSDVIVYISFVEVYPGSIKISLDKFSKEELTVMIAEKLIAKLEGRIMGEKIDKRGCFLVRFSLDGGTVYDDVHAKFELVQEDYMCFIRLVYICLR